MLASSVHSGQRALEEPPTQEELDVENQSSQKFLDFGEATHSTVDGESAFVQEPFKRKSPFLLQCLCKAHC